MKTRKFVLCASYSLFLFALFVSPVNAETYKWVDEYGETQFGDRVPEQYRGDRQNVSVRSNTMQRNDRRAVDSGNPRRAISQFDDLSQFSNEEWEQRVQEMEAQRRKVEEGIEAQALKPRTPKRAPPRSTSTKEQYEEYKALERKAQENNAKLLPRKRTERPKSYEQRMKEYKKSQECFNRARNVNGTINAAMADIWGCKNMERPRRD